MAILAENNMITFISNNQTLTGFCFTKAIEQYTHLENNYTLMFKMSDGSTDFFNLLDITDELGIRPNRINEEDLFMINRTSKLSREQLFNSCDTVMQGFAIWYDVDVSKVQLKIVYLDNPEYKAIMTKVINHLEVSSSNMPLDILYKMKFIVDRNEKLLTEEWEEKVRMSRRA